ncbi:MAG: transcriptional regulator, AraC family [Paenibacillus sp.]|nr:transcriptional regulator, AraC family [Paenibacillus sp.]
MGIFDRDTMIANVESVMISQTIPYVVRNDRMFHGFIYKTDGVSQYFFNRKMVELNKNEMMYLPEHSNYEIRSKAGGSYMIVNFSMQSAACGAEPTKIVFADYSRMNRLFQQIQHLWVLKNDADVLLVKSLLYQMMSEISRRHEADYISPAARTKIAEAIQYLRQHLYDTGLRVSALHELLGISNTYFRKLFQQVYGMTPIQYINRERIEQAKALLRSGEFHTVEQVAYSVGYSDLFYFCKVFKTDWRAASRMC